MSFFVVRRHGVTSRPQDSPKGDTYINLIILVYYEKIIERSYMKVSKLPEPIKPLDDSIVKVTAMGNVFEVSHICYSKSFCSIKKLDSDTYIDLSTGEVKDFNHNESRADDKNSVRTSLSKLRNYINTNVVDVSKCLWVTLTYAENMTDTNKLYTDFDKFNKRLKYHLNAHYEYIVAMEPQGRGAWHAHLLLIFDDKAPFVKNEWLRNLWGHGFVRVQALKNADNIGAYLTAYLADMELDEADKSGLYSNGAKTRLVETVDENGNKISKAVIKGARLALYPPNFNLFRCSRGIKKPAQGFMPYGYFKEHMGDLKPVYESTFDILNDDSKTCNRVYKAQYNKKRK